MTVFVKYGVECLFGKPSRKVLDLVDTLGKRGDATFIANYVKMVVPLNVSTDLNRLVSYSITI